MPIVFGQPAGRPIRHVTEVFLQVTIPSLLGQADVGLKIHKPLNLSSMYLRLIINFGSLYIYAALRHCTRLWTSRKTLWRRCLIQHVRIIDLIRSNLFTIIPSLLFNRISNELVIVMTSSCGTQFFNSSNFNSPFFLSNNPTSICLSSSRDSHCLIPIGPNFEVLDKFWKTGLGKKIYWATRIMEITKLSIFEVRNSEVIFFVKPKGHQVPLGELIARIFEEYLCQ